MNKIKYSVLTLGVAAMFGMSSCADSFLDVSSKTESNTDNFYKSESDAWRALIGCYDGWRQISSNPGVGFYIASTIMSDEAYGGTGVGDGCNYQLIDRFNLSESPSDLNVYSNDWKVYYAGVYRCNELITRDAQIEWRDEAKHSLYMGEVRALRAFLYFDMVRLWGNIPLFLEPSSENRAQTDPAEVYAHIFDDLRFAIENIPATANLSESDNGRITKYAAESILARAYLYYTGYYGAEPGFTPEGGETIGNVTKAEALAAVEDVISSGKFELLPDFKNLWPAASLVPIPNENGWDTEKSTYAGDANKETILAMKFTPSQDYNGNNDSNRWLVMMGMRSSLTKAPYHYGWGACTVVPSYLSKFEGNDSRLAASVIDINGEGINNLPAFQASYNDWREYTGYTVKKYTPLAYGNGNPGTNADGTMGFQECNPQQWTLVRYADVLLMAAELGSSNAATYMHMVRERAGLGDIAVNKDNIMAERARELAFEGIRYWDLLRQGIDVAADAICASAGSAFDGGRAITVNYNRQKIIDCKGLSQIPEDQLTLSNGVLKQNPGWN